MHFLNVKPVNLVLVKREVTVFFELNTPQEEVLRTLAIIPEKGGIRGVARATGHSKNTISRWLEIAGTHSKEVTTYFSTSPTGSRNHLASFRFQNTFR